MKWTREEGRLKFWFDEQSMGKLGPVSWFRQWLNVLWPGSGARLPAVATKAAPRPNLQLRIEAALLSDMGLVRKTNEDRARFVGSGDAPSSAKGCLALVADGVGGQAAGDVASGIAAEMVPRIYFEQEGAPGESLRIAMQIANREVHRRGRQDNKNMATTCTTLAIRGGFAWCGHVGDSRLYLIRGGEVYLMTEDHSMVMEWQRQGILSPEEARRHPARNVITRSLGSRLEVDVSLWNDPFPVMDRDVFALCTDGLYEYLEQREFLECAEEADLQTACQSLIDRAKARGGDDNLTLALLRVRNLPATRVA